MTSGFRQPCLTRRRRIQTIRSWFFSGGRLRRVSKDLELVAEGDVLEDQRLAGTKWSSDQVQDEVEHPGRLAAEEP